MSLPSRIRYDPCNFTDSIIKLKLQSLEAKFTFNLHQFSHLGTNSKLKITVGSK